MNEARAARMIPPAGSHGGDSWRLAESLGVDVRAIIDLSASMNPFAPDVGHVIARIAMDRPEVIGRYPDEHDATLLIAQALDIDPSLLVLTNGGSEAIALVATNEGVGDVVDPEFSLYARHLPRRETGAPRWRSNPSNPLGLLADPSERARVWDEAFFPIATGTWSRGDHESWRLGSLTKLWSCPGLRLGYAIAPSDGEADEIRRLRPQWSVNGLALAAVPDLLSATDLPSWSREIHHLRTEFGSRLSDLGFAVEDTDTNWILVRRSRLREELASHLVLVRDCRSFGLPDLARIALPHPDQFEQVVQAFERVGP